MPLSCISKVHGVAGLDYLLFVAESNTAICRDLHGHMFQRYILFCIQGEFTLEEANTFIIATLDDHVKSPSVGEHFARLVTCKMFVFIVAPDMAHSAIQPTVVSSMSFSSYLVETYSVLENIDAYSFYTELHFVSQAFEGNLLLKNFLCAALVRLVRRATLDVTPSAFDFVHRLMIRAGCLSVSIGAVVDIAGGEVYANTKIGEVSLSVDDMKRITCEFKTLCAKHFSLDPDFAVLMFLQQEPHIDADHIVLTPDNIIRSSSTTVIFAMRELAVISEKNPVVVSPFSVSFP